MALHRGRAGSRPTSQAPLAARHPSCGRAAAISASACNGLSACPPGPAVLVGTDIPSLGPRHIAEAFRLLGHHDVVFGPAADGGFWLVGARRSPRLPPLFGQVRWSSPHTLEDALAGLPRRVSVGIAATLQDVDDGEAYRRLMPRRGL